MLEALDNRELAETFSREIRRRGLIGLACVISFGGGESVFAGSYPKQWGELEKMPLTEQLRYLTALAAISPEQERYPVDEVPKFEIVKGGKKQ